MLPIAARPVEGHLVVVELVVAIAAPVLVQVFDAKHARDVPDVVVFAFGTVDREVLVVVGLVIAL